MISATGAHEKPHFFKCGFFMRIDAPAQQPYYRSYEYDTKRLYTCAVLS